MSDQQESRPLTRRERRLLEMAANAEQGNDAQPSAAAEQDEAGAAAPAEASSGTGDSVSASSDAAGHGAPAVQQDEAQDQQQSAEEPAVEAPSEAPSVSEDLEAEIEISPFDEDGNPRSRREMRRLREEALAKLEQERAAAAAATEAPVVAEEPVAPVAEPVVSEPEPAAPEAPAPEAPAAEPVVAETVVMESVAPEPAAAETVAPEAPEASAPAAEPAAPAAEPAVPAAPQAPEPVSAFGRAAESAPEPAPAEQPDSAPAVEEPSAPVAQEAPEAPGFDAVAAPTEPFSLADLREAENAGSVDGSADPEEPPAFTDLVNVPESELTAPTPVAEVVAPEAAPEKPKSRLPWRRAKAKAAAAAAEAPAVEAPAAEAGAAETPATEAPAPEAPAAEAPVSESVPEAVVPDAVADPAQSTLPVIDPIVPDAVASDPIAPEVAEQVHHAESARADEEAEVLSEIVDEPVAAAVPEEPAQSAEPVEEAPKQGYSFPDIVPPEEWRSVFDDPSTRVVPSGPRVESVPGTGAFDDLISRAVVEEGGTDGSNTAALILPSMPEDGGLTGPLGGTGELFVTGSIEVPKSIGETGGHASLHDSVEMDPVEEPGSLQAPVPSEGDGGPVSARRAVSAISQSNGPTIAEVKKDRNKLPLILSLTGGTLVLGVGALVVWGATNGLFG